MDSESFRPSVDWSNELVNSALWVLKAFGVAAVSVDLGKAPSNLGSFHAGLGVNIAGKAAGDTPTITDYLTGGFAVTVTNAQNDCVGDVVICADFPVFISNVQPPGGNLKVTTTLGSGDLTALFSDTGTKVGMYTAAPTRASATSARASSTE